MVTIYDMTTGEPIRLAEPEDYGRDILESQRHPILDELEQLRLAEVRPARANEMPIDVAPMDCEDFLRSVEDK